MRLAGDKNLESAPSDAAASGPRRPDVIYCAFHYEIHFTLAYISLARVIVKLVIFRERRAFIPG